MQATCALPAAMGIFRRIAAMMTASDWFRTNLGFCVLSLAVFVVHSTAKINLLLNLGCFHGKRFVPDGTSNARGVKVAIPQLDKFPRNSRFTLDDKMLSMKK
jgi:hypothetical protein